MGTGLCHEGAAVKRANITQGRAVRLDRKTLTRAGKQQNLVHLSGSGAPRRSGMQVCRYAASLIQRKPGKGEGLGDPGVYFLEGIKDMSLQPPLVNRRGRGGGRAACSFFFLAELRPLDPAEGNRIQRHSHGGSRIRCSIRLAHRDMSLERPSSCCEWTRRPFQHLQGTWHIREMPNKRCGQTHRTLGQGG